MTLLLALSLAIASSTCRRDDSLDRARESACRLTGGRPDTALFASCTTRPGSCAWTTTYRGCIR